MSRYNRLLRPLAAWTAALAALVGAGPVGAGGGHGGAEPYVPTGRLIADSGFRPDKDGFSFPNYGIKEGVQNLTPGGVADIFGPGVCVAGQGESCILTPGGERWMEAHNAQLAGGHCVGFSVSALRFFAKSLDPDRYGAATAPGLQLEDNPPLQELLAETWAYQLLPSVERRIFRGTPNQVLAKIQAVLREPGRETWTVGMLNEVGGHAVTPYAVEQKPGSKRNVLVYDNNFPGITRAIEFDTRANTYLFRGGPDPGDTAHVYRGTARTSRNGINDIYLIPTSPGTKRQACAFCGSRTSAAQAGSAASASQYDEIHLTGNPANHGHLLITDRKGNRLGYVRGRLVNEIPGAEIIRSLTTHHSPEPKYRVPVAAHVTVTVDGSGLERADTEELTVIGPSEHFHVAPIRLHPGQKTHLRLSPRNEAVTYWSDRPFARHAPALTGAISRGRGAQESHYEFSVASRRPASSSITLLGNVREEWFGVTSAGNLPGRTRYRVVVSRATSRRTDNWVGSDVRVDGGREAGLVSLAHLPGRRSRVPVRVFRGGRVIRTERLRPNRRANRRDDRRRRRAGVAVRE